MDVKVFDNINDIVRDDMISTINKGSKISIAAACFSIYAYKELKEQLEEIDECRFIVNDTLRMYKNDDIRMYNFDCITDTIVEVITTCNTYTLLTVHLL